MESLVKQALVWNVSEWRNHSSTPPGFKRLINSLKFWLLQLAPALKDYNVILTLYNPGRHAFVSLERVINAIVELDENIAIKGYARFKNKRYVLISFFDTETRDKVVENLKLVESNHVVFLHWACLQELTCNLFWLTDDVDMVQVMDFLSQYFKITAIEQIKTKLKNGMILPSGAFRAQGVLNDNIKLLDIPHFDIINQLQVLITIPGRTSVCYKCLQSGHLARCCQKLFCHYCLGLREAGHVCKISFPRSNDNPSYPQPSSLFVSNIVSESVDDSVAILPVPPSPSIETALPVHSFSVTGSSNRQPLLPGLDSGAASQLQFSLLSASSTDLCVEPPNPETLDACSNVLFDTDFPTLDGQSADSSSDGEASVDRINRDVQQYESMLADLQRSPFEYVPPPWLRSVEPSPFLDQKRKKQEKEAKHKAKNTKKRSLHKY